MDLQLQRGLVRKRAAPPSRYFNSIFVQTAAAHDELLAAMVTHPPRFVVTGNYPPGPPPDAALIAFVETNYERAFDVAGRSRAPPSLAGCGKAEKSSARSSCRAHKPIQARRLDADRSNATGQAASSAAK